MRTHWREIAPPAHVSLAALTGFRPVGREQVEDPQDLTRRLREMGLLA